MHPEKNESHPQPGNAALSELIWSWGRKFWHQPAPTPRMKVSNVRDDGSLLQQMQLLTAQQLATAMRMHGVKDEDDVMLTSLEHLAMAGEMEFHDFAVRVQNLFPKTFEQLDVTLRMKVASLILPDRA